jgi:hypothetical protein
MRQSEDVLTVTLIPEVDASATEAGNVRVPTASVAAATPEIIDVLTALLR